jgi:hypothetical protein
MCAVNTAVTYWKLIVNITRLRDARIDPAYFQIQITNNHWPLCLINSWRGNNSACPMYGRKPRVLQ